MVSDIRVAVSFKGHRKRRKFRKLLGRDDAVEFLLDLWITTAMNHPEGSLEDMDETDIALEAGWTGDANFFVQALMEAGLIERLESGKYAIHDWEEHQGYVVHAPERKEKARKLQTPVGAKTKMQTAMLVAMLPALLAPILAMPHLLVYR